MSNSDIPTSPSERPPEWALELTQKVEDGFAIQEGRFSAIETALDIVVQNEKTFGKQLGELQSRIEKLEQRSNRVSSSARFRVPSAHEIEVATSGAELVEKARDLCKQLRGWSSATGVKLPYEIPTELEEAIARYDTIRQKP